MAGVVLLSASVLVAGVATFQPASLAVGQVSVGANTAEGTSLTNVVPSTVPGNATGRHALVNMPAGKLVSANSGGMVAAAPATQIVVASAGSRLYGFDTSVGSAAPPDTLGGLLMTPFGLDPQALATDITSIADPCAIAGSITFSQPVNHRRIGSGWMSWSHGYTGDVYYSNMVQDLVVTLPVAPRCGIYFYIEPDPFTPAHTFTITADDGTSATFSALGSAGAAYCGIFGANLTSFTIHDNDSVGYAIGEFGMACFCEPIYRACCYEATEEASCQEEVEIMDCIGTGGRWDIDATLCVDLQPPCGEYLGACCYGAVADEGYEPWQCIGDMLQWYCLYLSEYTNWTGGETCSNPFFLCPGTPTYCDASGGCDEYIARVQMGDIDNGTGCDQYTDYTATHTLMVLPGVAYPITVTNGTAYSADVCAIWVDWNVDKTFEDAGPEWIGDVVGGGISPPYSFTLTLPDSGWVPGYTRMRIRIDYSNPDPDPCGTTTYGEVEDYSVLIVEPTDPFACCNIHDGTCTDILVGDCLAGGPGYQWHYNAYCATLVPPCGDPGCCCDSPESGTPTDPRPDFRANCDGRFLSGVTGGACVVDAFSPVCGTWIPTDVLYAPTWTDNAGFRATLSSLLGSAVVYFDAVSGTPTMADLEGYAAVFTWVNYPYADAVGMGNVLADFVDAGGRVILGQWCKQSDAGNYLAGRIMDDPNYCPVLACSTSFGTGAYNNDGVMCVHNGPKGIVGAHDTGYLDMVTEIAPGAMTDGTIGTSYDAVFKADMSVVYSPGNTAAEAGAGSGDWVTLVANMVVCQNDVPAACCNVTTAECLDDIMIPVCIGYGPQWRPRYGIDCVDMVPSCGDPGACCDIHTGDCADDVLKANCAGQHTSSLACTELEPMCGDPGCCCDFPESGEITAPHFAYKANCSGRFISGALEGDCVAEAFVPECGMMQISVTPLGMDAPPADVCGLAVTPFALDPRPTAQDVSDIPTPCPLPIPVGISPAVNHRRIGSGWMSWSHGYTGDVYYTNGATAVTLTLPPATPAVYFYVEPNPFEDHTFTVLVNGTYESEPFMANGSGGAAGVAVCAAPLETIVVTCTSGVDFAIGEFGIVCAVPPPGACCNIYTGECVDEVEYFNCVAPLQWHMADCGELNPPCGDPGCCCDNPEPGVVTDPYVEFRANCDGRFRSGVLGGDCVADAFSPECGLWVPSGLLYCPTNADNGGFRGQVSALLNSPVDYFDARTGTPTLESLSAYAAVMTWVNYPYADNVAMGNVLADFKDLGGRVILGQWCLPTAGNSLSGRIMTADYCPATGSSWTAGTYTDGSGLMMPLTGPVGIVHTLTTNYCDVITVADGAIGDGDMSGHAAVAFWADYSVIYSPGLTADYTTGDIALLTANEVVCTAGPGACCNLFTAECIDEVLFENCAWRWYSGLCADLIPPCGDAGACCDATTGSCIDDVLAAVCASLGRVASSGVQCGELPIACGDPGCCCDYPESGEVTEPHFAFKANCSGRFISGAFTLCGDLDENGVVDMSDYNLFLDAFGKCTGQPGFNAAADLDGDGCITLVDFQAWRNCYQYQGTDCTASAWEQPCGTVQISVQPLGTNPPPAELCGQTVVPFGLDPRPLQQDVTTLPRPCIIPGDIVVNPAVNHRRIGSGWMSWSHGYTGDVYYTNGATAVTLTMPAGTAAVYFYVEPNPFELHTFQVLVNGVYTSEPFTAHGSAGAAGVGICGTPVETVVLTCTSGVDFSIGEFGITCIDVLGACCQEWATPAICTDDVLSSACAAYPNYRFAAYGTCDEMDPLCGELRGACCYETECSYQRPVECAGEYQGDGIACDPNPCLCADLYVFPVGDPPLVLTGTTCGMGDDCALRSGEEVIFAVTIPWPGTWTFSLCGSSFDTYWFFGTDCCTSYWSQDDSTECGVAGYLSTNFEPGLYYIDLEGYSSCGAYTLTISGPEEPVAGACCNDATGVCQDSIEAADCIGPFMRHDPAGTCDELSPVCGNPGACCDAGTSECADGVFEGACTTRFEAGVLCADLVPACGQCADAEMAAPGSWSGDTCGAVSDCALRSSEDLMVKVIIPSDGNWKFDLCASTPGWDTYLYVGSDCCTSTWYNDDGCTTTGALSTLPIAALPAGEYYATIEAYGTACGPVTLTVATYEPEGTATKLEQLAPLP